MNGVTPPSSGPYKDDDLVYVDPEKRSVVGRVEWTRNDKPKSLAYKPPADVKGDAKSQRRQFFRKFYPWGTFRSMRRIFKLEGKVKDQEPNKTLDEVLPRAVKETFWDWNSPQKP
jgi:hypothetical protein